jgi:hypothetical protein
LTERCRTWSRTAERGLTVVEKRRG